MTEPIDIYNLLERCAALESEALSSLDPGVQAQAFPYSVINNDVYPYFTNQTGQMTIESDSEDVDEYTLTVNSRLIVGHTQGGAKGEYEGRLYEFIPQLIHYFNEREVLQSKTFKNRPSNINFARIVNVSALTLFRNSGTGQDGGELGVSFTIEINLYNPICQQYL